MRGKHRKETKDVPLFRRFDADEPDDAPGQPDAVRLVPTGERRTPPPPRVAQAPQQTIEWSEAAQEAFLDAGLRIDLPNGKTMEISEDGIRVDGWYLPADGGGGWQSETGTDEPLKLSKAAVYGSFGVAPEPHELNTGDLTFDNERAQHFWSQGEQAWFKVVPGGKPEQTAWKYDPVVGWLLSGEMKADTLTDASVIKAGSWPWGVDRIALTVDKSANPHRVWHDVERGEVDIIMPGKRLLVMGMDGTGSLWEVGTHGDVFRISAEGRYDA